MQKDHRFDRVEMAFRSRVLTEIIDREQQNET